MRRNSYQGRAFLFSLLTNKSARITRLVARCAVLVLFGLAVAQAQELVIEGGTLIDGNGGPPRKVAALIISGNRIKEIVAEGGTFQVPSGAQRISAEGLTIVPGLIDSHVHYQGWDAELYISHGVTSVIDVGSGGNWIMAQREGVAKGKIFGPRIFCSIRGFAGGVYGVALGMAAVRDVDEAVQITREMIALKADIIKLHDGATPAVIRAVANEAHRAGLPVMVHLGTSDARDAAEAGADVQGHLSGILTGLLPEAVAKRLKEGVGGESDNHFELSYNLKVVFDLDMNRLEDLAKLLVQKQTKLEPDVVNRVKGLYPQWGTYESEIFQLLKNPDLAYIPEEALWRWRYQTRLDDPLLWPKPADFAQLSPEEKDADPGATFSKKITDIQRKNYEYLMIFLKRFIALGGEITMGSDAQHRAVPGLSYHQEMQLLVENAGMTPMQAIVSATRNPARLLHKEKDLGTLEVGKLADLLLVRGDPLQNIRNLRNIEKVIKDGQIMKTGYHATYMNPIPARLEPGPGGSSSVPVPIITSLTPNAATEGDKEATVKIKGNKFAPGLVVSFDGRPVPYESPSVNELTIKLGLRDLAQAGTYRILVTNPRAPGGGPSNPSYFYVKFR